MCVAVNMSLPFAFFLVCSGVFLMLDRSVVKENVKESNVVIPDKTDIMHHNDYHQQLFHQHRKTSSPSSSAAAKKRGRIRNHVAMAIDDVTLAPNSLLSSNKGMHSMLNSLFLDSETDCLAESFPTESLGGHSEKTRADIRRKRRPI